MEGTELLHSEEQEWGARREPCENRPGSGTCSRCARGRRLLHLPFLICRVRGSLFGPHLVGVTITDSLGNL